MPTQLSQEKKENKLNNKYRLVVMNHDTYEEVASYKLTRMNIYLLLSSVFVLLVILVTSVIVYTPLRFYIPGYGDVNTHREIVDLSEKTDSLEKALKDYQQFFKSLGYMVDVESPEKDAKAAAQADTNATSRGIYSPEQIPEMSDTLKMVIERAESDKRLRDMPMSNLNMLSPDNVTFVSPFTPTAMIMDKFSPESGHFGVDIADKESTPVKAVMGGVVIMATWSSEEGYVIGVQHKNNYVSFYKHNSKLLKKVGSFVKAGEAIAIIGNTGTHSSGPHLHFELWYNSQPVNPTLYIH